MDLPVLESVPNVSVGRDVATVDALVAAVRSGASAGAAVDGSEAVVADVHRDSDHDRAVLTIVGRGEALAGALETLAREVVDRVDLHAGHGVHPRVGALDVVPIVPLSEDPADWRAAHDLVERVAAAVGGGLGVPVVRYGLDRDGTAIEGAHSTGAVRRGGPATVGERIRAGELELIAGPARPHPTAGVTMCGVRRVLIAFNVDLEIDDLECARVIAGRIRDTAGPPDALPGVRSLGLHLGSRRVAQVSTNIESHARCGPARVLEHVARIAEEAGVGVSAAELVGLAPDSALAPLRYACSRLGVPLLCAAQPSLDLAVRRLA